MDWLAQLYVQIAVYFTELFKHFNPKEWGDWLHLVYVAVGLLWIGYQFNRLRGRSAKAFDAWVEGQANRLRKNLQDERKQFLDRIRADAALPVWRRSILAALASLKLAVLFFFRVLFLRRWRPSVRHAMTVWRAGWRDKARKELEQLAQSFERKLPTYVTLEEAKRLEAGNAFLFAGRAAEVEADSRRMFDRMLRLSKDRDPDAHKLIARQYLQARNTQEASAHIVKLTKIADESANDRLKAEALRLEAEVLGLQTRAARKKLLESLRMDQAQKNYKGLGEGQELLGDIYENRPHNWKAAVNWYWQSHQSYGLANDHHAQKFVQSKINKILGRETWVSWCLERFGMFMLRLATRTRAQPQTSSP